MTTKTNALVPTKTPQGGKIGYALAWLIGIPLPILVIVYAISRC
jgi:hypothetical protein